MGEGADLGHGDRRSAIEIDVRVMARDPLSYGHAFFFGLVRQHRPAHDVTDRPHTGDIGPAQFVDDDKTAFIAFDADRDRKSTRLNSSHT